MVIKKLRIEDVVLGLIVGFSLIYPIIIAVIIYKSEPREHSERLNSIVESIQSGDCEEQEVSKLTELCKKINKEGYKLRGSKLEGNRAELIYGKKVKGMEKKLIVEIVFEGEKISSVSYEERN